MRASLIFLLIFAGCDLHFAGGRPPSGTAVDVDGIEVPEVSDFEYAPDAGTVRDAGGLNAPCTPAVNECSAGFTCHHIGGGQGRCRLVGAVAVGGACENDDSCGANMTCMLDGGVKRCFALCDRLNPLAQRCTVPQVCDAIWGAELTLGICIPI